MEVKISSAVLNIWLQYVVITEREETEKQTDLEDMKRERIVREDGVKDRRKVGVLEGVHYVATV